MWSSKALFVLQIGQLIIWIISLVLLWKGKLIDCACELMKRRMIGMREELKCSFGVEVFVSLACARIETKKLLFETNIVLNGIFFMQHFHKYYPIQCVELLWRWVIAYSKIQCQFRYQKRSFGSRTCGSADGQPHVKSKISVWNGIEQSQMSDPYFSIIEYDFSFSMQL